MLYQIFSNQYSYVAVDSRNTLADKFRNPFSLEAGVILDNPVCLLYIIAQPFRPTIIWPIISVIIYLITR